MIHTLSNKQLKAYNSLHRSEQIGNIIEHCIYRHVFRRKPSKIDFTCLVYFKEGYIEGSHDGDCINNPQTCRSCGYHEIVSNYIDYYPLFIRLNGGRYEDILTKFMDIYCECNYDPDSEVTNRCDKLFWDIYYELKAWRLL